VSWGTQLQRDTVEDRQASIDRTLQETYTNVGLFVQDDWKLGPRKSLLYGVRADRHSAIEGAIFSPRLAFLWNPKPDLALRSAVSTGFRPPAVFDEDLHIEMAGGSQRQVVFSPNLEEERSLSVLQGVAWNPKIRERFWLVDANLFYTRIEDIFEENQLADDVFEKVNGGSATVRGIELGLGYDLPRLFTIELGWVSQRSRFAEPERDFGSRDFLRTPRDSGVLNLSFRSVRLGEAFIGVRYTGPMKVPRWLFDDAGNPTGRQLVESDEFLTIDASVSRRFDLGARGTKLRLQIGARNLTDEFQNDIDQGAYRDSAYVYGPRYPRSFYLTTALSF
jgi:outer membrane receptor for ferrienterochelin and colicins